MSLAFSKNIILHLLLYKEYFGFIIVYYRLASIVENKMDFGLLKPAAVGERIIACKGVHKKNLFANFAGDNSLHFL